MIDHIIGELIIQEKYKFVDKALLAEIVQDTYDALDEINQSDESDI